MFFANVGKKDHLGPDVDTGAGAVVTKEKDATAESQKVESKTVHKPKKKQTKSTITASANATANANASAKKNGKGNKRNWKKNDPKASNKKNAKGKPRGKPNQERKKKNEPVLPLTDLKLGSKVVGRVAAFTEFGIFIRINYDLKKGGRSGYALLHKSQIRDTPVAPKDLKKMYRIGAVIKDLRVLTVNYAKGEVALSLREQRDERKNVSEFEIGKDYEGKITRIVNYGAFVELGAKANALLHISRISQKKIKNIRNWVNEGDTVVVRIIDVDEKKNTMAASMLDSGADEYLDRRSDQIKKMRERSDAKKAKLAKEAEDGELKSELEYFEDAVSQLESALK
jgi:predicted RNA-binding protein with RPS1 domain